MKALGTIRKLRLLAGCVLTLTCALGSVVVGQESTTTGKKAAAPKDSASSAPKASTSSKTSSGKHSAHKRKKSARVRGQQKIDSERAEKIQEALIRVHYLSGNATGVWNQASEEAMRRYQADNGWQSKTVPDSRALIKLGLGPSKDHLLNPESAMTSVPDQPKAEPVLPTSHSAPTVASPLPVASPSSPAPTSNSSSPQ